jgi:hypothetical protein
VVFEAGADNLLSIVQVLRANEADDRVHQQRLELASDGVRAGFERLLIDAVVRFG